MESTTRTVITVESVINAPVDKVWKFWTRPEYVTQWNHASDDWHSPHAENDFRVGGKFLYKMAARDGSFEFDFWGVYDYIKSNELIAYTLGDGRKVTVRFLENGPETKVEESFEAENVNAAELQKHGWQSILNNFKKFVENN